NSRVRPRRGPGPKEPQILARKVEKISRCRTGWFGARRRGTGEDSWRQAIPADAEAACGGLSILLANSSGTIAGTATLSRQGGPSPVSCACNSTARPHLCPDASNSEHSCLLHAHIFPGGTSETPCASVSDACF